MPPPESPTDTASTVRTPEALLARFQRAWVALETPRAWRRVMVAVSGGSDSLALLHLLHETRHTHRMDLVVAHVDHGIHPDSAEVAQRVMAAANDLGIPIVVGRLGLGAGTSETSARVARHAWLQQVRCSEGADAIVLAHHADDQVETVLLRVLAGSGLAGLAGMRPRQGRLLRPLLEFRKGELVAWLASKGIPSWEDPANLDPVHERSWIRSALLPMLLEREPAVPERLRRLARHAAVDRAAWEAALDTLPGLDPQRSAGRLSVAALPLVTYDSALANTLLRAAARRVGCVLGPRRAERLLAMVRGGRSGATLELGGEWRAELSFGRICFHQVMEAPPPIPLRGAQGRRQWGTWRVFWRRAPAPSTVQRDGWVGWFIGEEATLRAPLPGDRLRPLGGTGRRAVARLLQEARIERSRRGGWPIVELEGNIEWVGGICRGAGALPAAGDNALMIEVSRG
ncbi:MAG: tRNA lysidine(34) synthetase TilS [Gemmatimonadales bacterium]